MFSSKGKESTPTLVSGALQPVPPKRTVRSETAPSIISADVVVNGTLISTGDIQIDGRVEGDVHSAGLVIGQTGQIHGEILAEDITVRGHVKGRIRARKVLLCSEGRVEGDILHEAFAVEVGAFFEGNCRHSDNPLADTPKKIPDVKPTSIAPAATQQSAPASHLTDGDRLHKMPRSAPAPGFLPLKVDN